MNFKKEKGITMISLVVALIIILIVLNVLVYNALDSAQIKALTNLYSDIGLLRDKVSEYYNEYGAIPAKIKYKNEEILGRLPESLLSKNNDTGDFYIIDLEAMQGITLNYGKDYEEIKNNEEITDEYTGVETDLYIINSNSHNIFYLGGVTVDNDGQMTTYFTDYTEADETEVDLRYIDGVLIPEEYYYIGRDDSNNIVISQDREEEIDDESLTQFIWYKRPNGLDEDNDMTELSKIKYSDEQNKTDFLKSVNNYKGYFKSKNKENNIEVVYIPLEENRWSEEYEKNGKYTDKNGDVAYIPKGYRVSLAEGTNEIRNGLVITSSIDETTSESNGNEFVWVPVNYFYDFKREDFGETINPFTTTDEEATEEKYYEPSGNGNDVDSTDDDIKEAQNLYKSVKTYKGFYIGRYETGISVDTARTAETTRTETPVIQKDKRLYNYVTFSQTATNKKNGAKEIARNMFQTDEYSSTLCYGVQWDAIMRWINNDNSMRYILTDSTGKGNYKENENPEVRIGTTGYSENYAIKNIYDLAGNVSEWTMEMYGTDKRVARGGNAGALGNSQPIANREPLNENTDLDDLSLYGFRVALYIK